MVLNYIQLNLNTVTLTDVAKHFGFSISYCSRLIKASTGLSFNEWRSALRMRRAERMLLNTNKTVAAISEELGYMNPETFIRSFKKFTQMTPTQYRKQIDSYTRNQNIQLKIIKINGFSLDDKRRENAENDTKVDNMEMNKNG